MSRKTLGRLTHVLDSFPVSKSTIIRLAARKEIDSFLLSPSIRIYDLDSIEQYFERKRLAYENE